MTRKNLTFSAPATRLLLGLGLCAFLVGSSTARAPVSNVQLYPFPWSAYFPNFADGMDLIKSEIVLYNPDPYKGESNVELHLKDTDGNPLSVGVNGEIVEGKVEAVIPPEQLGIFQTDGSGPLRRGSATLYSQNVLAGVVLLETPQGLAGVPATRPFAEGFVAPMEFSEARNTDSALAIVNPRVEPLDIRFELVDVDGNLVATAEEILPGLGQNAFFPTTLDWSREFNRSEFRGTLRATSDGSVAAIAIQAQQGGDFATLPVTGLLEGATELRFPLIGDGEGIQSQLLLFNLGTEPAIVRILLKDRGGEPLAIDINGEVIEGHLEASVPVGGLRVFETDGVGALSVGSAVVQSTERLGGVILFRGDFMGFAGVGNSPDIPAGFLAPMRVNVRERINTGLAIFNLEPHSVTNEIRLLDAEGTRLATAGLNLPPAGQTTLLVNQLDWTSPVDFSDFRGFVKVGGNGRLAATVIQTRPGQMATMPVARITPFSLNGEFKAPKRWVRRFSATDGWHPRMLEDVNGDGLGDVVGFDDEGVWVSLSQAETTGEGFTIPSRWVTNEFGNADWLVDRHPRLLADVNDDQKADLVGFYDDGVVVALSVADAQTLEEMNRNQFTPGTGFGIPSYWLCGPGSGCSTFGYDSGWRVDQHPRVLADVNGDRRDDIVGFGGSHVYVALATQNGFEYSGTWMSSHFTEAGGWEVAKHPRLVADVNGDEYADIVGFSEYGVVASLADPSSRRFDSPQEMSGFGYADGWRVDKHPRFLADVNGDGFQDVVGFGGWNVYVSLGSSDGFQQPSVWLSSYFTEQGTEWYVDETPRILADVNFDGKADIVGFGINDQGVSVSLAEDGKFSTPTLWLTDQSNSVVGAYGWPEWLPETHPRTLIDVTGDQKADIVGFHDDGVYVSPSLAPDPPCQYQLVGQPSRFLDANLLDGSWSEELLDDRLRLWTFAQAAQIAPGWDSAHSALGATIYQEIQIDGPPGAICRGDVSFEVAFTGVIDRRNYIAIFGGGAAQYAAVVLGGLFEGQVNNWHKGQYIPLWKAESDPGRDLLGEYVEIAAGAVFALAGGHYVGEVYGEAAGKLFEEVVGATTDLAFAASQNLTCDEEVREKWILEWKNVSLKAGESYKVFARFEGMAVAVALSLLSGAANAEVDFYHKTPHTCDKNSSYFREKGVFLRSVSVEFN